MKIICKNCEKEIEYKYNMFRNSCKISCKNCGKVYTIKDIGNNMAIYLFLIFFTAVGAAICQESKNFFDWIIRLFVVAELADLCAYFYMCYEIKKHGLKK